MPTFVLVHSPVVGPITWSIVANELRRRHIDALTPSLLIDGPSAPPYWQHYARAVARAVEALPADRSLVLVGHSWSGLLLPAMRQGADHPVAAYLFVDAVVPERDGMSRFDLFNTPEEAEAIRQAASGGFTPNIWQNEAVLGAVGIEDAALRQRFVAEVPSVPLALWEEPAPLFAGWPDAPCGYLAFSQSKPRYQRAIGRARTEGWAYAELEGAHLHMLVDPPAVADALVDLAERMGIVVREELR
ncbi:MAG: alpha/beta hydrolase [Chloroflexi bacterium]|nr:alpha/beta hydrolase [Chloroflexota bacterium]